MEEHPAAFFFNRSKQDWNTALPNQSRNLKHRTIQLETQTCKVLTIVCRTHTVQKGQAWIQTHNLKTATCPKKVPVLLPPRHKTDKTEPGGTRSRICDAVLHHMQIIEHNHHHHHHQQGGTIVFRQRISINSVCTPGRKSFATKIVKITPLLRLHPY